MNLEEIKKDLDAFIREFFYGFSTYVTVDPQHPKMNFYGELLKGLGVELGKIGFPDNFLTTFLQMVDDYRDNRLEEERIRLLHTLIIRCRSLGIIIHNNDAISSLKMEKYQIESDNERLAEECRHLNEELDAYKKFVALQGKSLQTGVV